MVIIIEPQSSGISGNMMVGALIDLGAPLNEVKTVMETVGSYFGEINVEISKINKKGIQSTYVNVLESDYDHIHYKDLNKKFDNINYDLITDDMKYMAKNVFKRIALSESKIHGKSLDEIHFHEVGSADAVADVLGSIYAYYQLELDKKTIYSLPPALGGGIKKTSHGIIPIPAPSTLEILKDTFCQGGPVNYELTTPTGAALLMEFTDEFKQFYPQIKIKNIAYGAGTLDLEHPNILRITEGQIKNNNSLRLLETNIDHLSGEVLGYLFEKLLSDGALDVNIIPIIMKKNRPAYLLRVLCKSNNVNLITKSIFQETGTLGIRSIPQVHRDVINREFRKFKVNIGEICEESTFKVATLKGDLISARIEFEDAKSLSSKSKRPLKDVIDSANCQFMNSIKGSNVVK